MGMETKTERGDKQQEEEEGGRCGIYIYIDVESLAREVKRKEEVGGVEDTYSSVSGNFGNKVSVSCHTPVSSSFHLK